jgi:hypothetical protein
MYDGYLWVVIDKDEFQRYLLKRWEDGWEPNEWYYATNFSRGFDSPS